MREYGRVREIVEALSSEDVVVEPKQEDVVVRLPGQRPRRLRLNVVRGAGLAARDELAAKALNVFVDAGPVLTAALREHPLRDAGIATPTGLLRVRLPGLAVDVERPPAYAPRPKRPGPRLRGLSELVVEWLLAGDHDAGVDVPPLATIERACRGALDAGPSDAQIQKVLARLASESILAVDRSRGPRFTRYYDLDRATLLRRWAQEYTRSVVRSVAGYVTARDAEAVLFEVVGWRLPGRWAVGGPAAAHLWRPVLTRMPAVELWVDSDAWPAAARRLEPVDSSAANIVVRSFAGNRQPLWFAHHREHRGVPVVSPPRAYVEAATGAGPRVAALADALFESLA